jgi:hypothetical protein
MRRSLLLCIPFIALACSNPDSSSEGTTGGDAGAGGTGAGGTGGTGTGSNTLLQPPETGVQLATGETTVVAGTETYKCWSFDLPSDAPFSLVGLETQVNSPAVHHFGVFTNSAPGKDEYDCEKMGITWGLVSGGGVGTPAVNFPAGTAMTLPAGAHIIVQLHLLNASSDEVTIPPVLVNLTATKETKDLQPVGLLIAGTLNIKLPAQTKDIDVSGGCDLEEPMEHVFAVFPHMHKLGRRILAKVTPTDGSAERMISDIKWDFSDQGLYEVDGFAKTGDHVTVGCTYDNPQSKDVNFGLSTTDEMCVDVLYYYPAQQLSKYCGIP